jgi:mxaJ protein
LHRAQTAAGPIGGYFSMKHPHTLQLSAVQPWLDGTQLPMVFDVSMGVRKDDYALQRELDAVLRRNQNKIRAILKSYGVPLLDTDIAAE